MEHIYYIVLTIGSKKYFLDHVNGPSESFDDARFFAAYEDAQFHIEKFQLMAQHAKILSYP